MKKNIFIISLICLFAGTISAQSQYVNPFVGTAEHGHTYPGAIVPFGAVQLSPDTRLGGWDGCSGYHYSDNRIYGFSHTHLSGTGCEDYCDILVTPFVGEPSVINDEYALPFSHKNEHAEAGYYSVKFDNGIFAEMTAGNYVGMHRYTFPKGEKHGIIVDLQHRDKTLNSGLKTIANDLVGFRTSESWSTNQYCAFSLKTSAPIEEIVYYQDDKPVNLHQISGTNCKAVIYFGKDVKEVVVKVAISAVDEKGAINNQTEISDFDFDKTKKKAQEYWNKELGKIEVTTKNKEYLSTFYTALYHCFTSPYLYSDLDGRYRGADNKIHSAENGHKVYTVFSLWDTYRALHPLLNMIDKKRSSDFMYTFQKYFEHAGYLPMWELSSYETWCMIGYHAAPVILDAYMKGIRDFDAKKMLEAMIQTANLDKLGRREYATFGYVPGDMENESVSKTLEYAYDDWCIAMFAKEIGNKKVYEEYIRRAQSYKNIIDSDGFMHGRMNGGFVTPFNPREVNNFYTEANSWQYSTYVPHDFSYYAEIMGGNAKVEAFLDQLFNSSSEMTGRAQSDITGVIGQYAHGNEPSHHAAYLYNFTGHPHKTQKLVKQILTTLYSSRPDGLCGNEDCGQMSAWYVLSAMGFYPVCPGNNQFIIGFPLFNKVVMHLENGKKFTITKNNDKNYIYSAKLNGNHHNLSFITFEQIEKGGNLSFEMDNEPSKWGKGFENMPVTEIDRTKLIVPTPVFSTDKVSFGRSMQVTLSIPRVKVKQDNDMRKSNIMPDKTSQRSSSRNRIDNNPTGSVRIYYTTDGSTPTPDNGFLFTKPIPIDTDMVIKAVAVNKNLVSSNVSEAHYVRYSRDKDIQYIRRPDPQYFAGEQYGLIDNLRGKENYRIGGWQGFTTDFEAVIDLHSQKDISTVGVGCLEEQRSWIFMPKKIEIWTSSDGKNYEKFGEKKVNSERHDGAIIKDFEVTGSTTAQFVKIKVTNFGKLPQWHISAGEQSWLFIDEVWVK